MSCAPPHVLEIPTHPRRAWELRVRILRLILACMALTRIQGAEPARAHLDLEGEHRISLATLGFSYTTADQFGASIATGDFDGDGIIDAAFGLPGRVVAGHAGAGAVVVVYGHASGLGLSGARSPLLLTQSASGDETSEAGDAFGFALAAADFDGSGQDDLVVGAPFEDLSTARGSWTDAGVAHVFWGGATGVVASNSDLLAPDDFACSADFGDGLDFGYALQATDRDGDPNEDLVIGMPGANRPASNPLGAAADAGSILMLTGHASSTFVAPLCWVDWNDVSEGSRLGVALALGDTNNGGAANEVVVGTPFGAAPFAAEMSGFVIEHRVGGTTMASGSGGENLGAAVVAGDFRGAGFHQVLVGAPESGAAGPASSGRVRLYDGWLPVATFEQGTAPLLESAEGFDRFGQVLGVGDFNRDGHDDAVFGVPGENLDDLGSAKLDAGVVQVLYGDSSGLASGSSQLFDWDNGFTGWSAAANDRFGAAVAAGDFDGDGVDDLAVGAAGAFFGGANRGVVQVIYGQDASLIFADGFEAGATSAWVP